MEEPQFDEVEVKFSKDCVHVSVVSVRTQSDCDLDSDIHTRHQATGSSDSTVTEPQKVRDTDSACDSHEEMEAGRSSSAESIPPDSSQDPVGFDDLMSLLKQALPPHYLHAADDNHDKPSPSQNHGDDVLESLDRFADVIETRCRAADVIAGQDRHTDVLGSQDHTADVTETQDSTADVTENRNHTADVATPLDHSNDVIKTQNPIAAIVESQDHAADVIKTRDHTSDVTETEDHAADVIQSQDRGADVAEATKGAEAASLGAVQMAKCVGDSSGHSDADELTGVDVTSMKTQALTVSEGCCTPYAEDRVKVILESTSQLQNSAKTLDPGSGGREEKESSAGEGASREKEEEKMMTPLDEEEREKGREARQTNTEERTDATEEDDDDEEKERKGQHPKEDGNEGDDEDDDDDDDNSDAENAQSLRIDDENFDMLMAALHGGLIDDDDFADEVSALGLTLESFQECQVCLESRRFSPRPCCQFYICQSCFKNYLSAKVSEGIAVNIQCPSSQCRVVLSEYEVSSHLSNNLRIKFFKFLSDARHNPTEKTCPRCGREERVEKKTLKLKSSVKKGVQVRCQGCDLQWCFTCHAPWHEGLKCKEFRKGDKEFAAWVQETSNHQANARKCPACKIYIQRAAGCCHMTCNRCSTEFCYDCGKRFFLTRTHHRVFETTVFRYMIGSHTSRLSPLGCSRNFLPNSNTARRLIRGSVLGARVIGGVIALALAAGAAVVVVTAAPVIWGVAKARRKIRNRRS